MKKVLFIIPSLELGGAEILLINHLNKLDLHLYEPTLLVVSNKTSLTRLLIKDINVVKINASKFNYLFKLPKILSVVISLNPDVIHSHLFKANILSRFLGVFTNAIIINHYHGLSNWLSKPKLFLDKITQSLMDFGIVVSKKSYDLRLTREKIKVSKLKLIYNFINHFPEKVKYQDSTAHNLTLGMACRLIQLKKIPSVLKLVKFLNNNGISINLEIAGDGPEKEKIINVIKDLGISDKVKLLGFQPDLSAFYNRINIYVVASQTEDLPMSLIESMSYGCAIISSDVGGIREIVSKGEGLVVNKIDENNYERILNYIKKLNFDLAHYKNREISKSLFSFSSYKAKMDNLYFKKFN